MSLLSLKTWRSEHMFWCGLGFGVLHCLLILVLGKYRNWNSIRVESNVTYAGNHLTLIHTDPHRKWPVFLPEPYKSDKRWPNRFGLDRVSRWYYWQLNPNDRTTLSIILPWILYGMHLFSVFGSIFMLQLKFYISDSKVVKKKYSSRLYHFNIFLFLTHVLFHILHTLQTHFTYDGLAQHTSVASSQSSVIMILIIALLISVEDRCGLFFAGEYWKSENPIFRYHVSTGVLHLIKRYHGYAFAWATIYTFWYHPMENTIGHILGTFYTWMLALQSALAYTDIHKSKLWNMVLEMFVVIHAGLVARETQPIEVRLWPMFVFGFCFIFLSHHIFAFSTIRRLPRACRYLPLVLFCTFGCWFYRTYLYQGKPISVAVTKFATEVVRIPLMYVLFVFVAVFSVQFFSHRLVSPGVRGGESVEACVSLAIMLVVVHVVCVLCYYSTVVATMPFMLQTMVLTTFFIIVTCASFYFIGEILRVAVKKATVKSKQS